jgi:peptidoglycan-associated lipoprotein
MKSLKRIGLVCAMVLMMAASFGCATQGTSGGGTTGDSSGAATTVERAVQTITEGIVYFEFDKFDIQPQYNEMLRQKADLLKQYPSIRVRIEGNCDERGTEEYNLALGGRRARSAHDYLLRLGVSPKQMETISYGESRPAMTGSSEEAWAKNRRDDFQILSR